MNSRVLTLGPLTALGLAPPQLMELAAAAGLDGIGIRMLPAASGGIAYPLMNDATQLREALAAKAATGMRILDLEMVRIGPVFDVSVYANFFETGAKLGASHVLVAIDDADASRATASFVKVCEALQPYALTADLEFMPWTNAPMALYHGANTHSLPSNPTNPTGAITLYNNYGGLTPTVAGGRPDTDFGRGFYTTTYLHQAKQWANAGVELLVARSLPTKSKAVVLRYDIDRDVLAGLDVLAFARDTSDFYELVNHCRTVAASGGGAVPPHGRTSGRPYDIVYGPVSLGRQQLCIKDADQISFHTSAAFVCLGAAPPIVYELATAADGKFI